jgi:N6-adenosine-specific RNA methylase IME4
MNAERVLRLASMGTPIAGPMPFGEWDVIVADPPWRTEFGKTDSRSADRHYHTLDAHDIAALELPVARDALLFLWVPASMLPTGLFVMARWGFSFRTSAVWCKDRMGVGHWFRAQHEVILLGRRGKFAAPARGTQPRSVFHAKRRGHSEKPEELQDAIEATYPAHRYLELFARRERAGWTCWGDQVQMLLPASIGQNGRDVSEVSR